MGFLCQKLIVIAAGHIPGTINIEADKQSRALEDTTEWKLNPALFHKIVEKFGKPVIYPFTTKINKQLDRYMSWHLETRGNGYQCLLSYLEQKSFLYVPPSFL